MLTCLPTLQTPRCCLSNPWPVPRRLQIQLKRQKLPLRCLLCCPSPLSIPILVGRSVHVLHVFLARISHAHLCSKAGFKAHKTCHSSSSSEFSQLRDGAKPTLLLVFLCNHQSRGQQFSVAPQSASVRLLVLLKCKTLFSSCELKPCTS